jgi:hypothetical protein
VSMVSISRGLMRRLLSNLNIQWPLRSYLSVYKDTHLIKEEKVGGMFLKARFESLDRGIRLPAFHVENARSRLFVDNDNAPLVRRESNSDRVIDPCVWRYRYKQIGQIGKGDPK